MHSNEFCCENKTFVQWFVCFSLNRILPELQISKSFQCKQTLDIGHCYLNISIFFEIYRKKHFIISPEHCNTAKHLNNDLSHLTSDYVSDKFSGNMEDALDILILLLISCIIAKLEMIKCNQTFGHCSPHHLKEAESMQERRLVVQSSGIWVEWWDQAVVQPRIGAPTFSTITQLGPARRGNSSVRVGHLICLTSISFLVACST